IGPVRRETSYAARVATAAVTVAEADADTGGVGSATEQQSNAVTPTIPATTRARPRAATMPVVGRTAITSRAHPGTATPYLCMAMRPCVLLTRPEGPRSRRVVLTGRRSS